MLVENKNLFLNIRLFVAALCLCLSSYSMAADKATQSSENTQQLYAKVGIDVITIDEFNQTFQRTVRQRYYHSKPPEGELAAVRQEVADELITRQLLLQEATRLGLTADESAINNTLTQYDERYANSSQWKQQRIELLKKLQTKLHDEDILQQLESKVRNVSPPSEAQLKKFYQDNPQKFTEPMQQKISLILLVVDPSSAKESWDVAMQKGKLLVSELQNGADFNELARIHSGDISSEHGGDMGYIHREMLSEAAQKVVDALKPGQISAAVRVLQGVAILRLDAVKPEKLREYKDVSERARGLWLRQESESAWLLLKEKLRLDTPVTVFNNVHNDGSDV